MSNWHKKLAPLIAAIFLVSGCAGLQQKAGDNPKATTGAVAGAVLGGLIGGIAGGGKYAAIGAAAGALVGGAIGHHLDDKDKQMAAEAAQRAFESSRAGMASTWSNPDSGNSGSITPTKTMQLASGQYCRQYQQTVNIGGQSHQAYGTACRGADGTWKIQS